MSFEEYADRGTEPEGYSSILTFVGNGAAQPAKPLFGRNATVTRTNTGLYLVTYADNPGAFIGMQGWSLQAVVTTGVAGWTVVAGAFTAAAGAAKATLVLAVFNSAFAATDLPTTATLSCDLKFKRGQASL